MSRFRPTRASPPSKSVNFADSLAHTTFSGDISRSSALSVRELVGLGPDDIELLEAIIRRAGPEATTFLTIFKAYNDILQERGLDPHEVVFYGKLLKLGTLKGKNWGDKWSMVKQQHGYVAGLEGSTKNYGHVDSRKDVKSAAFPRVLHYQKPPVAHDDSLTLHSHENDTERGESDAIEAPHHHRIPRPIHLRPVSPVQSELTQSFSTDIRTHPLLSTPPRLRGQSSIWRQNDILGSESSDVTEVIAGPPSTTPPSYRAALRDTAIPRLLFPDATTRSKPIDRPISLPLVNPAATARQTVAKAMQRRGSVVNEDDAWQKVKMSRDEQYADRFREEHLLERCFEVWKQGFQWIIVRFMLSKHPLSFYDMAIDNQSTNRRGPRQSFASSEHSALAEPYRLCERT